MLWTPALNTGVNDLNQSVATADATGSPPAAGTAEMTATAGTGAGTGNSGPHTGSTWVPGHSREN